MPNGELKNMFENIFVGQLLLAEKNWPIFMTHERFFLPDTVSCQPIILAHFYCSCVMRVSWLNRQLSSAH